MRAAVLHEVGKPLSVEDVPEPEAGEGQSVVDVKAAGINFADVLIKNGQYPQPPPLPAVLGNEVGGRHRRAARRRVRRGGPAAATPSGSPSTTSGSSTCRTARATPRAPRF